MRMCRIRKNTRVTPQCRDPLDEKIKILSSGKTRHEMLNLREGVILHVSITDPGLGPGGEPLLPEGTWHETAIFFFHGVGGSTESWYGQTSFFSSLGFHVICLDLLGHGVSSAPKDTSSYSFQNLAFDALEVFDKYKLARNIIVGHSYGTSFVVYLASKRQTEVHQIILMSGGGPFPLSIDPPSLWHLPLSSLRVLKPILIWGFRRNAFHESTPRNIVRRDQSMKNSIHAIRNTMLGQQWSTGDSIFHRSLRQPCLLVYGVDDKLVPFEEEILMHNCIFQAHMEVIESTGHMVMQERPNVVNGTILKFINTEFSMEKERAILNKWMFGDESTITVA